MHPHVVGRNMNDGGGIGGKEKLRELAAVQMGSNCWKVGTET